VVHKFRVPTEDDLSGLRENFDLRTRWRSVRSAISTARALSRFFRLVFQLRPRFARGSFGLCLFFSLTLSSLFLEDIIVFRPVYLCDYGWLAKRKYSKFQDTKTLLFEAK